SSSDSSSSYSSAHHPHLHSFPTRRSSDLGTTPAEERLPCWIELGDALVLDGLGHEEIAIPILDRVRDVTELSEPRPELTADDAQDRKSTRLNSSHDQISYAVFCLKKKKT